MQMRIFEETSHNMGKTCAQFMNISCVSLKNITFILKFKPRSVPLQSRIFLWLPAILTALGAYQPLTVGEIHNLLSEDPQKTLTAG